MNRYGNLYGCHTPERTAELNRIKIEQLARAFSAQLLADIGEDKLKEVNALNDADKDVYGCHSHDFCDANMSMDAAFTKVIGHETDVSSQSDTDIWNAAWTIAKENKFFIG